jgi:hypothetical protein
MSNSWVLVSAPETMSLAGPEGSARGLSGVGRLWFVLLHSRLTYDPERDTLHSAAAAHIALERIFWLLHQRH